MPIIYTTPTNAIWGRNQYSFELVQNYWINRISVLKIFLN